MSFLLAGYITLVGKSAICTLKMKRKLNNNAVNIKYLLIEI
jgi:hypothetical protein